MASASGSRLPQLGGQDLDGCRVAFALPRLGEEKESCHYLIWVSEQALAYIRERRCAPRCVDCFPPGEQLDSGGALLLAHKKAYEILMDWRY